jgi:transcriptional regulator with XRE-family HTH domain
MRREGFSQAELARKHGLSRARVNQWLSLLNLQGKEIRRIWAMGDYWDRKVITERELRIKRRSSQTDECM